MADNETIETIADLELYGLPIRVIEALDRMGCLYIAALHGITEEDLLSQPSIGIGAVHQLIAALENLRDGHPTKTVQECIRF